MFFLSKIYGLTYDDVSGMGLTDWNIIVRNNNHCSLYCDVVKGLKLFSCWHVSQLSSNVFPPDKKKCDKCSQNRKKQLQHTLLHHVTIATSLRVNSFKLCCNRKKLLSCETFSEAINIKVICKPMVWKVVYFSFSRKFLLTKVNRATLKILNNVGNNLLIITLKA